MFDLTDVDPDQDGWDGDAEPVAFDEDGLQVAAPAAPRPEQDRPTRPPRTTRHVTPPRLPGAPREVDPGLLARLAEQARPVAAARTRLLPVLPPLTPLLPDGALRRGSTLCVVPDPGSTDPASGDAGNRLASSLSLALALVAAASTGGTWCTVVGVPDLGALGAAELGVDLARLALVPDPAHRWVDVVGALLEGVDAVVLRPPFPPRPRVARRLAARVRERGGVLLLIGEHGAPAHWGGAVDLVLATRPERWQGIVAPGLGHLRRHRVAVSTGGRRFAGGAGVGAVPLWLPADGGEVRSAGGGGR